MATAIAGSIRSGVQSGQPLTPIVTAVQASSLVIKASPGILRRINALSQATAGWVMLFNATSLPSNGTVTPVWVRKLSTDDALSEAFDNPLYFSTGIVVGFSSTGPFSLTASVTAFFAAQYE